MYYKLATFEPELREYVSFAVAVRQSCDFQSEAPRVRSLYSGGWLREYVFCTTAVLQSCDFRAGSTFQYVLFTMAAGSGSTFSVLRLYYKVATFEPELREYVSFATAVLQSCDFRARAPGVRFLCYGCTTKLRLSSQSSGSTFPLLRRLAPGVRFLHYWCATKLRLSSRSSGSTVLRTRTGGPQITKMFFPGGPA